MELGPVVKEAYVFVVVALAASWVSGHTFGRFGAVTGLVALPFLVLGVAACVVAYHNWRKR